MELLSTDTLSYTLSIPIKDTIKEIFSKKTLRSRHVLIAYHDDMLVREWSYIMSSSSGAKVSVGTCSGDAYNHPMLLRSVREITPNLLSNVCILFVIANKQSFPMYSAQRLSSSIRANLVYLIGQASADFLEVMKKLKNMVPTMSRPVLGRYTPSVGLLSSGSSILPPFKHTLAYSHFLRDITTQFASFIRPHLSKHVSHTNDSNKLYVIGYNPQYVASAIRCGLRAQFLERNALKNETLVLPAPSFLKPVKDREEHKSWVRSSGQIKLSDIDNLAFTTSNQIIYIGCHPGTHLYGYRMPAHKILFIDPALTDMTITELNKISPGNTKTVTEKFLFNVDYFKNIINGFINVTQPFTIIDDSWVPGTTNYENFQRDKINFFSFIIQRHKTLVSIFMKLHIQHDIDIPYTFALFPQPHGGSLTELRLVMNYAGTTYPYRVRAIRSYLDRIQDMSLEHRLRMIKYYHKILLDNHNGLAYKYSSGDLVSAMFSLSNTYNPKKSVLAWLQSMYNQRTFVIFSAPNKGRIEFLLDSGYDIGLSLKLQGDILTFRSPHRDTPWTDFCYSMAEMREVGYVTITPEIMAGILSTDYTGVGYYLNSHYCDVMDIYVPEFVLWDVLKYQHIGTSPMGIIKSFTHMFLMNGTIQRGQYYAKRGALCSDVLTSYGVNIADFYVIGDERISIVTTSDIDVSMKYGHIVIPKNTNINISGHLLSMTVSAHFVPTAVNVWIHQLLTMTGETPLSSVAAHVHNGVELFDNKLIGDHFEPWHSLNELILTMEILHDYTAFILNGKQNYAVINDICDSFVAHLAKI